LAAPLDIFGQIHSKLWEILEDNAAWAAVFPVQNRINYTTVEGDKDPDRKPRSDDSYPQARLEIRRGRLGLFQDELTLETHSESGPNHWNEKVRFEFALVMTSQLHNADETHSFVILTTDCFRQAGPRLGLNWVTDSDVSFEVTKLAGEDEGDEEDAHVRTMTTFLVAMSGEIDGVLLKGS
jgi:hypothetical protein